MAEKNRKNTAAGLNIYLTGFMCAGKTSSGKALARLLKRRFSDSDRLIEKKAGCKITEFVARGGLKAFRASEAKAVRELAQKSGLVAALGGGVYPSRRWAKLFKTTGTTVYLRCAWPELAARLESRRAARPLLAGTDLKKTLAKAGELFGKRKLFYEKADITVDVSALTPRQAALKIKETLETL